MDYHIFPVQLFLSEKSGLLLKNKQYISLFLTLILTLLHDILRTWNWLLLEVTDQYSIDLLLGAFWEV